MKVLLTGTEPAQSMSGSSMTKNRRFYRLHTPSSWPQAGQHETLTNRVRIFWWDFCINITAPVMANLQLLRFLE